MATATPMTAPARPASRRRRYLYLLGGFSLLIVATPIVYCLVESWMTDRELEQVLRELDEDDPNWRWPDLLASLEPPPDERNSMAQAALVHALLRKKPFSPGPKWEADANQKALHHRNARLNPDQEKILQLAFGLLLPETLAEARKLKDMPEGRLRVPSDENPIAMRIDNVQNVREVMYLLQLDAYLRAHQHDMPGAIDSCLALTNAAAGINDHPTLIGQLVRIAGDSLAIAALERTLAQGETAEGLDHMQARLEAEARGNFLYHGLRGERGMNHQVYLLLRHRKMPMSSVTGAMGAGANKEDVVADLFPGFLLRGYPEHLRMLDEMVKATRLKPPDRAEAFDKHDQKVRNSSSFLTRMLMPAVTRVAAACQRSEAMLRSAATAVAAERYRLQHGRWPPSADELVKAGLIKEVYLDPFDGKPLRWRRTPTGLIIYSIGHDCADNGGKLNRENPQAAGSDLGFELWDLAFRAAAPIWPAEAPAK